jgi:hypothetical protein
MPPNTGEITMQNQRDMKPDRITLNITSEASPQTAELLAHACTYGASAGG